MTSRSAPWAPLLLVTLLAGCATGTVRKAQGRPGVPPGARVLVISPSC